MRDRDSDRDTTRRHALERCKERGIVIPTLEEQRAPHQLPRELREQLLEVPLSAVDPRNLFRISWHNDVVTGGFGEVNALELPPALTGVRARVVGLLGARFPTGAHKVGAAFGCLVPRMVAGEFDPVTDKAVWPSTGNFCRGGVFDSALLGCQAVAILPREMSAERFRWLESMGAEIVATPGCESNVKEIFDACWAMKRTQPAAAIFNQFEELGNYLWHYGVTGPAAEEAFTLHSEPGDRLAGWVSASGSAGTLAAGDYLKQRFPGAVITAAEALQCPTLLENGFGAHRIEGIGDKHVPWIHNVRNTDLVTAVDDEAALSVFRLFNEHEGQHWLASRGVSDEVLRALPLLGISGAANLLAAVKTARWYELDEHDVLLTAFTDSAALYQTRLEELRIEHGPLTAMGAAVAHERYLLGAATDRTRELAYRDRKALHNLKYFTWVEQQGRTAEELERLWSPTFWTDLQQQLPGLDAAIRLFNEESGAVLAPSALLERSVS